MSHLLIQADALHLPLADQSVDLVFGSPPYLARRSYGVEGMARGPLAWVEWMLAVTAEALRVCRGPVLWVAAGDTVKRCYRPVCEGLMWEWWKRGGECHLLRPCYWHRVGISGSGGDQWFRSDIEYVMCFKRPGKLPWACNIACGSPPRFKPGGAMSHRTVDGARVNRGRESYLPPAVANPGNLLRTSVGKGHMGHPLAHENVAPFPVALPEFFIRSLCRPGGICLDPFSGSGTTVEAALKHGRHAVGIDLRSSQCDLSRRRISHPHAPVPKRRKPAREHLPLFD